AAGGASPGGGMSPADEGGGWLYRALHQAGFASQSTWERADDGLRLIDCYLTAVAHCAPPANKPAPDEILNCRRYLQEELAHLTKLRVVVALGRIAFEQYLHTVRARGLEFGHNREHVLGGGSPVLIASYHPSRQNTNTGKLTEAMLDAVFCRAKGLLGTL